MQHKVDFQRPDYAKALPKWELVDDCDEGQLAIKGKEDNVREKYLPRPNPTDRSQENRARYDAYVLRAVFVNYCQRTITGLVGQVYSKEPVVDIPGSIDALIENVDDTGVTLDQQSRKAVRNVLKAGRGALLVDFPAIEDPVRRADADTIKASIICYDPKSIVNWRVERVGNQNKMTLIVIETEIDKIDPEDEFSTKPVKQWLDLRLVDGVYSRRIWEKQERKEGMEHDFVVVEDSERIPTKGDGSTWNIIPFTFIGSANNDADIDQSPTYDMAVLNIGHYRNSADYEESVFVVGQPMYVMAGLSQGWVDENFKEGFQVGSRRVAFLPVGGSGDILQPAPNTLAFEAMGHKEEQMVALGAKIVEPSKVQRTAKEAGMDQASENSVLSNVAANVSAAYEQALFWAWEYSEKVADDPDKVKYELNTDYEITSLDPLMLDAVIRGWQGGALTEEEMRNRLKKMNIATADIEEFRDQRDDNPAGLDAGDNQGGLNNGA